MQDQHARKIDYVRISLTDRCNLRCIYCMPEGGVEVLKHEEILRFEEIVSLCKILANLGVKKIKLTGGEPLVRKDIVELIKNIKAIKGIDNITMTTNGILVKEKIKDLVNAGLDGITISLDTLSRSKYTRITRRDSLNEVLAGLFEAIKYKNLNVKINSVPMMTTEDEEIIELVLLAKYNKIHIRFIEMMPIGLGKQFEYYHEDDIKRIIMQQYGNMIPYIKKLGNGPSKYYSLENFKGKIGFISAVSHKFCDKCNRVRITSDGTLKTCLQYLGGLDLKTLIRAGCDESFISEKIEKEIWNKPISHKFFEEDVNVLYETKKMSGIGG